MSVRRFHAPRNAFTLVELLVVILIIAILVSLVSSAVMMAMGQMPRVKTATEIAQLSAGIQNMMTDFNVTSPPPSKMLLYENMALYGTPPTSTAPYAQETYTWLVKIFGKGVGLTGPPVPPAYATPGPIDWNNDGAINGPWRLEGEQCLVFWLSGPPAPGTALIPPGAPVPVPVGFSTSGINPVPTALSAARKGPYYTFETSRLTLLPGASPFPVYSDPWQGKTTGGNFYAYFSTRGQYNGYYGTPFKLGTPSDCAAISAVPYLSRDSAAAVFACVNPNGFQIVTAGKDGVFGQTGWSPSAGGPAPGIPPNLDAAGQPAINDDQSNFTAGVLGVPQQ